MHLSRLFMAATAILLAPHVSAEEPKVLLAQQYGPRQRFVGAYNGAAIAGTDKVVYLTGRHIRREPRDTSWQIDERRIRAQLDEQCAEDYDGYILMDFEDSHPDAPYPVHVAISRGEEPWAEMAYFYLEQALSATRAMRPDAKLGFYDIPAVRHGVGASLNGILECLASSGEVAEPPLLRLMRRVDYCSPSLYYLDENQHRRATRQLGKTVRIARHVGIDTFVHVLHREHAHAGGRIFSVEEFLNLQVRPSNAAGAQGVFFWNALYNDSAGSGHAAHDAFIRPYIEAAVATIPRHHLRVQAP